mgnify:CR=1 FL=1
MAETADPGGREQQQHKVRQEGSVTQLLLALYLILLAFFIVLNALSTFEEMKTRAVQSSLASTFTSIVEPEMVTTVTSESGRVAEQGEFHTKITELFAAAIPAAKVEVLQPGNLMIVRFHPRSLFFPKSTEVRPARYPLIDRLVATIAASPRGREHEMELIMGLDKKPTAKLPPRGTLAIQRAGAFARLARDRGMPPDGLAVGVEPGHPDEVRMLFRTRDVDTWGLDVEPAAIPRLLEPARGASADAAGEGGS